MQICHNSHSDRYRKPFGAVHCGQTVTLNLYAPGCRGASVRLWQEGKGETMVSMNESAALFTANIKVPTEPCVLWYFFVVSYDDRIICYGNNPESYGGEGCVYENSQPPSFQITVYEPYTIPSWYKNALVYQIFPDRFARGSDYQERKEAASLPEGWQGTDRFFEEDWNVLPRYLRDEAGNVTSWQFFGGTLEGIRERIAYLKSLGISALYLNPIFQSTSNHRYDTGDYMKVDPLLGDHESFRILAEECRKCDIRIILDGVFSHTGADSLYFDKYGNYERLKGAEGGAYLHEDSRYRNWYRFREEEPGYECWWGVTDLPNVEETDPSYDMFICGPGGVLEQWLSLGASGFRLDVADELPDSFIRNIHDALKEADPDNLLIGEVWEDASNKYSYGELRKYFSGDELDGTMNYPFRDNAIAYCIGEQTAEVFCRKMKSLEENYPKEAFYGSLNLIGGHDCRRVLSALSGSFAADEDLINEDGLLIPKGAFPDLPKEKYVQAKEKLKILSALQYAMPGVPCVYYGDEAGTLGNKDPDNRRTYPWGKEDPDLLLHYRMLGLIYRSHPALTDGSFRITSRENCLFLLRANEEEALLTIINPSPEKQYLKESPASLFGAEYKTLRPSYALELLRSEELPLENGILDLSMDGVSAMIILLKDEAPQQLSLPKAAGVLCHLSSLPDLPGTDKESSDLSGALGKKGRAFVDWMEKSGLKLWQMLPVNPPGGGNSPYFSPCVFAGDVRYIDRDELPDDAGFEEFCRENRYWLDSWADHVLKEAPAEADEKERHSVKYDQYVFFTQLEKLKDYANSKGILLIGDLPIYTAPESADIKAHPECFQTDGEGHLLNVGGVPPDYFSEYGQYWSNPLYDWTTQKKDHYEWWYQRLRLAAKYFDFFRLDHFRSFSEYFAIPEGQPPKEGFWQQGPGMDFFRCMQNRLGKLNIIAEDLGQLDSGVYNLLKLSGFPGMNVWQFHAEQMRGMTPKESRNRIFYSGTHDNQTLVGWCKDTFPEEDPETKAKEIMEELMGSEACWVIFQLQDILLLDDSARINVPGTVGDNWLWKCSEQLPQIDLSR